MKTRNPPKWYVEYRNDTRDYAVVKDGSTDSLHWNRIEALQRIVILEEGESGE